jgi:hypothetical protein
MMIRLLPYCLALMTYFNSDQPINPVLPISSHKMSPEYQPGKDSLLNPQWIRGTWITLDSTPTKIEFVHTMNKLKLIVPGVAQYEFFQIDSLTFSNQGVFINWPPDNCSVSTIDSMHIKVEYIPFGENSTTAIYERTTN